MQPTDLFGFSLFTILPSSSLRTPITVVTLTVEQHQLIAECIVLKRFGLLIVTNILIVVTLSAVLTLVGANRYLTATGIDYQALMIFCLGWGMGGAFISLLISRFMAKMLMGVKVIDPQNAGQYMPLVQMVHDISRRAQLPAMPEVGVYESADLNAFATGPSKSRSLVAVSTGLLAGMKRDELEGVLAHEVAHIQNGDMVTMTLLQGIVNAFVMFFARIIAFAASQGVKEESRHMVNFLVTFVLEIIFMILGALVVSAFSRKREFRADSGSAKLVGASKMVAALEALQRRSGMAEETSHASIAALQINSGNKFLHLFATHPPLEERIKALQTFRSN